MAKKKTNTLDQVVELLDEYARLEQRGKNYRGPHFWMGFHGPGSPEDVAPDNGD